MLNWKKVFFAGPENREGIIFAEILSWFFQNSHDVVKGLKEECRHYSEEFFMNSQKPINAKFESVQDGEYYVQALAVVVHQTQMIKFVPFDSVSLSVVQPIGQKVTGNFWKILGGLALLVIVLVVCVKGFKKVKEFSEDRGFELEMFSKKKGYDMLGES